MRIAVIHGNDGSDVRIGKICRSVSRLGHDVHFIGWDRRPHTIKIIDLGSAARQVMQWETQFGRGDLLGYAKFARHVVKTLASLKPDVVHCVNEDFALLVLPFRGVLFDSLVCDVFDSLTDRHSHRGAVIDVMTRAVAEIVRSGADRLIATDEARFERFGRHRAKTSIIENVPEDPGEELSQRIPEGSTKLYVAGTLTESRGLRQMLDASNHVENLQIISAGWPFDEYAAETFLRHPKVRYEGVLTARQSLDLAASCDAVFAFYAPTSSNNLLASPNKIYDAMSVGRPVIINSEARVSQWVVTNGLGWRSAYTDVSGLTSILAGLLGARQRLPQFAARARQLYAAKHTWSIMEGRLGVLYDDLAPAIRCAVSTNALV